jgi:hypothetical protein
MAMMDTTPTRPVSPKRDHAESGSRPLLAWWVWPAGVGCAIIILAAAWAGIFLAPLPVLSAEVVPPLFTVYPPPTFTPVPPTLTPTPVTTPTIAVPTPAPGTIGVGAMVEVSGTGGEGVHLRDVPSTSGKSLAVAGEREIFTVIEGPRQGSGYTWWLLQGVYDKTRQGWAVENYIKPTNP